MSWNKFWSSFFDPKPAFKKTHFSAKNQTFRDQHFDFFSFYPIALACDVKDARDAALSRPSLAIHYYNAARLSIT
ncbi:uncharacterized protein YALI1_D31981g [Yarrowia lipolytica]|uniref:Uncharacterized protein n=1 Tax=Yarrowia lipolytica TaxID=4952 RepID=A0A1D8NG42_YARLL|nr:hypothetical protein YALI1_D31981g [Yarrowia lipolytica]